jgi:hypothetical protein
MTCNNIIPSLFNNDEFDHEMIAAFVSIAAIKASVYGNKTPNHEELLDFINGEIIKCLRGFDPEDQETKEALAAGVPEENLTGLANAERERLIKQAEWIAFGLKQLKG